MQYTQNLDDLAWIFSMAADDQEIVIGWDVLCSDSIDESDACDWSEFTVWVDGVKVKSFSAE